jgi:hypothetical protein
MPTIYLPFTHISHASAVRLSSMFGRLGIYHPAEPCSGDLKELLTKDLIDIRVPPGADPGRLMAMKKEYRAWADLHQDRRGIDTGAFMAAKDRVPFFDEHATAQIRLELKKLSAGEPLVEEPEPLLHCRLFLALAEEHDRQIAALEEDLKAIDGLEKQLQGNLQGEVAQQGAADLAPVPAADQDRGAFMTVERIRAWSCLFLADTLPADCLVTDSRAVMDQLLEDVDEILPIPGMPYLLGCQPGGADSSTVIPAPGQILAELARTDDPLALAEQYAGKAACSAGITPKGFQGSGFLVPGIPPRRLFERFADALCRQDQGHGCQGEEKHTLLAWLGG